MSGKKPPKSQVLLEGKIPLPWLVGVLAALGVVFIAAIIAFSAVNRISTCERCHLIKPEVETYKQSAHYRAGVGCQQCHTKPGVFNYFIRNLQGLTNVILYVSDTYERPLTTMVGTNNCVQCHPKSQIERDQVYNNIRVNHTGLREAGYQCVTCHANISHPGTQLEVARVSQNKMPICARCHDGVQLPDDCNVCHVGGAPPEEINVPITGKVTPQQCRGCHNEESGNAICADCHNGLEMPHPPGWMKSHGPIVVDRGKQICAGCHTDKDPRFCIDCHGLVMPHPSGWQSSHGAYSQRGDKRPEVRQVPRQGQLHQVPRPADAAPVRLDVAALGRGARQPVAVLQVPQQLVLRGLPRGRAAAQQRLHRRPPEPHVQLGQRVHEVPRQRRHGPAGLLRWRVPRRFHRLNL